MAASITKVSDKIFNIFIVFSVNGSARLKCEVGLELEQNNVEK